MLLLILFVLFYVVLPDKSLKITAEELVSSYNSDILMADKKFLNKEIELTGNVKSFFQFEAEKSMLELHAPNNETKLYCILMNNEAEEKASSLTAGTIIMVYGKCLGLNPPSVKKFPNSIYIEAEGIK